MRRAAVLFCSVMSLLISAGALAQEPPSEAEAPLAAAFKGAQHLAECTKALDAACVVALSDERSYWLWNGAKFDFAAKQARFYAAMQKKGYKYLAFDTVAPQKLYVDGGRLYTFIPYVSTSNFGGEVSTLQSYFIGFSRDGGDSWTFVSVGPEMTPDKIRLMVPSYNGQPLPESRWIDGRTSD